MEFYDLTGCVKKELQHRVEDLESALALYEQYHWEIGWQMNFLESELEQLHQSLHRICEAEQIYLNGE